MYKKKLDKTMNDFCCSTKGHAYHYEIDDEYISLYDNGELIFYISFDLINPDKQKVPYEELMGFSKKRLISRDEGVLLDKIWEILGEQQKKKKERRYL